MTGDSGADDPLGLDAEAMRALGYRTVDMLVARLTDPAIPPLRRATPAEMRARLSGPPPQDGRDFEAIIEQLERDVLPFMSRGDHPGFFAFVPFCGTWPGALGDFVASACNVYAGSWMESAGPTQLELEVLNWFKAWIGYPQDAGGILVGGGSAANLTALACAREIARRLDVGRRRGLRLRPVALLDRPRRARARLPPGAAARAARTTPPSGSTRGRSRRRWTPTCAPAGGRCSSPPPRARRTPARSIRSASSAACAGSAACGCTSTPPTAASRRSPSAAARRCAGIELADSVTLDPHKWLYQPYECGALLVRDDHILRRRFR